MGKKVLFISVPFMSLYKDVIGELEKQGYDVTYMQDKHFAHNSYDIHNRTPNIVGSFLQARKHRKYWYRQIRKGMRNLYFDYLLVIDGFSLVNSGFVELLEKWNPRIKKILYLFDKTYNNYLFDFVFKSFDKIFTFDIHDSQYYGINLLPIYWVPTSSATKTIDVFGFGTYMPNRYTLYNYVYNLTKESKLKCFIKLYIGETNNTLCFRLRKRIGRLSYPNEIYQSSLATHETIPPSEFRRLLSESRVILDSHDVAQDGLTARFMWALGSGAKIVTTNKAIRDYPFYDENQIVIFDEKNPSLSMDFFQSDYEMNEKKREIINQYRIDNWVKTLMA